MGRTFKAGVLALAVLAAVGLAGRVGDSQSPPPAAPPQTPGGPPDPFLIVPGTSIGPVQLGMPVGQVIALLGRYSSRSTASGSASYTWNALPEHRLTGRLLVSASAREGSEAVSAVSVFFDARYATANGIHVGDPSANVRQIMGELAPDHQSLYNLDVWHYEGIAFAIGRSGIPQCPDRVCTIGIGRGAAEVF